MRVRPLLRSVDVIRIRTLSQKMKIWYVWITYTSLPFLIYKIHGIRLTLCKMITQIESYLTYIYIYIYIKMCSWYIYIYIYEKNISLCKNLHISRKAKKWKEDPKWTKNSRILHLSDTKNAYIVAFLTRWNQHETRKLSLLDRFLSFFDKKRILKALRPF